MDDFLMDDVLNNIAKKANFEVSDKIVQMRKLTLSNLPERKSYIYWIKPAISVAICTVLIIGLAYSVPSFVNMGKKLSGKLSVAPSGIVTPVPEANKLQSFEDLLGTDSENITRVFMERSNADSVFTEDKDKIRQIVSLVSNRDYIKAKNQKIAAGYSYFYDFYVDSKRVLRISGDGNKVVVNNSYYNVNEAIQVNELKKWFNSLTITKSEDKSTFSGFVRILENYDFKVNDVTEEIAKKYPSKLPDNLKVIDVGGKKVFVYIDQSKVVNLFTDAVSACRELLNDTGKPNLYTTGKLAIVYFGDDEKLLMVLGEQLGQSLLN